MFTILRRALFIVCCTTNQQASKSSFEGKHWYFYLTIVLLNWFGGVVAEESKLDEGEEKIQYVCKQFVAAAAAGKPKKLSSYF